MRTFWAIAVGAAVGGLSRYYLASAVQQRVGAAFPWGTLLVNVTGSLLLGFIIRYALATPAVSVLAPRWLRLAAAGSVPLVMHLMRRNVGARADFPAAHGRRHPLRQRHVGG